MDKIKNDKAMDEIEILQEQTLLNEKNYIQPSISQYLEDKNSLTEVGLVDDRPVSTEEFLDMFDIKHLSKQAQDEAKKKSLSKTNQPFHSINLTLVVQMLSRWILS